MSKKVAIVYLSYHSEPHLPAFVKAVKEINYSKEDLAVVIVDNPHPTYGSSEKAIEEIVLPHSGVSIPKVVLLPQKENLGFCGGNNIGIKWAVANGFDYVLLHNDDGYLHPDCIKNLAEAMENDEKLGCASALIMLDGTNKVNTAGNSFNYLGFGFIDHFGVEKDKLALSKIEYTGYVTGAALMLRVSLLKKLGYLDEDLFLYHEDIEYSLRLKLAGYKVGVVTDATFYHKYEFSRSSTKFYYMERNRYAILLMYYKWPTLILLLPILIIMEIGLFGLFVMKGWVREKIKMYTYWSKLSTWRLWLKKRQSIQSIRKISDREILKFSSGKVYFGEKRDMNNPLLLYIGNPLMIVYRVIVKLVVFW